MTQNSNSPPDKIKPSFSGHETFPFRYTWLKKGVDAVRDDPSVFSSDRATITLGVGKNMVRSIRHWCITAGLIGAMTDRTQFEPTDLGKAALADGGLNPYLEDTATLWLIRAHFQRTPTEPPRGIGRLEFLPRMSFERKDLPLI